MHIHYDYLHIGREKQDNICISSYTYQYLYIYIIIYIVENTHKQTSARCVSGARSYPFRQVTNFFTAIRGS
jgi:hypothetical protein